MTPPERDVDGVRTDGGTATPRGFAGSAAGRPTGSAAGRAAGVAAADPNRRYAEDATRHTRRAEGYAIEPAARHRSLSPEERTRFRAQYGLLRTFFKERADRYGQLQRSLDQARFGVMYDEYLARGVLYAIVATVVGVLLGVYLTSVLTTTGVLSNITAPSGVQSRLTALLASNRMLFGGLVVTAASTGVLGGGTWVAWRNYPRMVVSTRTQSINVVLPHAIVYMYALSYGGMDLTTVIRSLARADDTYGEVAREFDMVVRDIELFGNDLATALGNLRNLTPSENLEQFLDDTISVLESGGDATTFLESEAKNYLQEAKDEQEEFLETLSVMSEIFIVAFVAAPLFLIVILVVISLLGGETMLQIVGLTYAIIPIGMVAFLVLIDVLSAPFSQAKADLRPPQRSPAFSVDADLAADERYRAYQDRLRRERVLAFLRNPLERVREEPIYSLVLALPVAFAVTFAAVVLGIAEPSLDAMLAAPFRTTVGLVVLPLLVVTVPLAYYHERKRAREDTLSKRFPDTLNILASANRMGISLPDGLALVSRTSTGVLSREIDRVRNDIIWNDDVSGALLTFGYRLRVPQLARTARLIAEGISSSGDLSRVLSIAAEDARNRWRIERQRRRELSSYVAIVIIGYLVFLLVVLLLDTSYLTPIAELSGANGAESLDAGTPMAVTNVPVEVYRAVFFHAALIQAVGSGLLAGKLADNSVLSGLKYSIALVAVSVIAFAFI